MGNTRSLDGIKIFSASNSIFDKKKELFNEKVVRKILSSEIWEADLFRHKICILFGTIDSRLLKNSLGRTFKIGTDECNEFIKRFSFEFNRIVSLSSYDFLVYFAVDISKSENEIDKTFTIAHELQHVIQFIYLPEYLLEKHTSLWDCFKESGFNTNELPKEKDAIRRAKIINYDINKDKKIVDDFIFKKISESCGIEDKSYWEIVRDIDKTDYDLRNEINIDCIKYNIC